MGLKAGGGLQSRGLLAHQFLRYASRQETRDARLAPKVAGLDGVVIRWNPTVSLPPDAKWKQIKRFARQIALLEDRDLFRYKSVRKAHRVEIEVRSTSEEPRRLTFVMPGDTETGATAPMLSEGTLRRFALDRPPTPGTG